jgi:hypothetical protein
MIGALHGVGAALALLLTGYALCWYAMAAVFLVGRRRRRPTAEARGDAVTVAVPARNEGDGAVRVLRSLLAQDHAGPLEIVLLLRDRSDTALPHLAAAFPGAALATDAREVLLTEVGTRRASVHFTGRDPKHAKVNGLAATVRTPWFAILDSDHEAFPDWIRTSVALLVEQGGRVVQSRRRPMSARGLFGLWDSLHQHVGCEVANVAYARLGLAVPFTGTTAVMDRAVLQHHPLRDCLTEDTDLTYELLLAGERLLYNPDSGSREEVSPDLYSFLARRRRWAHGHTEAFFRHLPDLLRAPIGWRSKAQFLFHGVHYLVAVAVLALHGLVGLAFAARLPAPALVAAGVAAAVLALGLVRTQRVTGWATGATLGAALVAWLGPGLVVALNAAIALVLGDPSRMALPVPLGVQAVALVGFLAPLAVLLAGMVGFGQLGFGSGLAAVVTWPVALYLDLSGVLLGLVDLLGRRRTWLAIARTPEPDLPLVGRGIRESWRPAAVLAAARAALRSDTSVWMRPSRWVPGAAVVGVLGVGLLAALPARRIPVAPRACEALEHDGHPWIVPPDEVPDYCGPAGQGERAGTRTGSFAVRRADPLTELDAAYWDRLDDTFFCNEAVFDPDNVVLQQDGGIALRLQAEARGDRAYTAGSIATKDRADARFQYGRFEVELKAVRASGVLTAFFLYRFDPWQEIDLEFLGKDPTKVLLNVFYNPGDEGDLFNYGYRGTPVLVDLGFDASADFHSYAIEWDPGEIRWFVDGALIHARPAGEPTPVPHLPMRLHVNAWPICSEDLAGPVDGSAMPVAAEVRSVTVSSWVPPLSERLGSAEGPSWRERAGWMQPTRTR